MRSQLKFYSLVLVVFIFWACSCEHPANTPAQHALDEVYRLVDEQNYRKMGFESVDELNRITLGEPIPVYFVGLNTLKEFDTSEDPRKLLNEPHEMFYPVLVDEQVRCSMGIKKTAGEWEVRNFGRPKLSRALAGVRNEHAESTGLSQSDYFSVEIPSMYLVFIGHYVDNKLMLTPVHDHEELGFVVGKTEPAEDVIVRIVESATDYKGPLSSTP
ncbi:hypothetical protein GWO43_25775 [candidate division KSB1 bacterium]|nr:hypothetical protein [candidate division KSB1 bacterium]NIR69222.1 hypothetical protein [candidate division KSB1 bacterium]NIS27396.1 hypothetical protein [candidate division KSB1 bacterium]NIT74221.1 hypothetical protein [candidate division KSB1 bacterium]NIU28113.1 hypothetical protein [candidate division KSB1 bacterium]